MKLEHRKQRVAPLPVFFARMARFTAFAMTLIVFSLGIGTFGYHTIGKLSWLDSFYMSSMILTGMGPVSEITSTGGKIFSSLYALYSGIAFLSISAVFFAPVVHRFLHILQLETDNEE